MIISKMTIISIWNFPFHSKKSHFDKILIKYAMYWFQFRMQLTMQFTVFKCFYLFVACLQILLANLLFIIIILFGFRYALSLYFLIVVVRMNFCKNILIYLRGLANFHIRSRVLLAFTSFSDKSKFAIATENTFW